MQPLQQVSCFLGSARPVCCRLAPMWPAMAYLACCTMPSLPTTILTVQGGECKAGAGVQPICPEVCQQGMEGAQGALL